VRVGRDSPVPGQAGLSTCRLLPGWGCNAPPLLPCPLPCPPRDSGEVARKTDGTKRAQRVSPKGGGPGDLGGTLGDTPVPESDPGGFDLWDKNPSAEKREVSWRVGPAKDEMQENPGLEHVPEFAPKSVRGASEIDPG